MAFIELTETSETAHKKILINTDFVVYVKELLNGPGCSVAFRGGGTAIVEESYEEVKKRSGLLITPRAETIAQFRPLDLIRKEH